MQVNHHRHFLAKAFVRQSDRSDFPNPGEFQQLVLDLDGVDILSAANNHVLGAIRQEQETVIIQVADIAGFQPAIADFLRIDVGAVPVFANIGTAAHPDFPGFSL